MNNKVIKVLDKEHGKRVIEFFKQYCDTRDFNGNRIGIHYGIVNGKFCIWSMDEIREYNAEIIELPEEKTYPRVMLVSQDNVDWSNRRVVFMEKNGLFLAWTNAETLEEAEKINILVPWKYAKKYEHVEVTLEEIAEWKGTSKEQIIIKQ